MQKSLPALVCAACQTTLRAEDLKPDLGLAICPNCQAVLPLKSEVSLPGKNKQLVSLPDGVEVYPGVLGLEIDISWRHTKKGLGFLMLFALFWNLFIFFFLFVAFAGGSAWSILPYLSLHILVGVGLAYYVLAAVLNHTYIYVNSGSLTTRHTPLPLPFYRNKEIASREIDQLYVRRYVASKTNGSPNYAFKLIARLKNGDEETLLKGITRLPHIRFVEQEVERFLGIADRRIEEEYKR